MNEAILPVKPDYGQLQQAYTELYREYAGLQSEYRTVVKTIIRAMDALGMWPVSSDNADVSRLARKLPGMIIDAMMPGNSLKDKFSFMKDIIPIAEKYKDIDVNNL